MSEAKVATACQPPDQHDFLRSLLWKAVLVAISIGHLELELCSILGLTSDQNKDRDPKTLKHELMRKLAHTP